MAKNQPLSNTELAAMYMMVQIGKQGFSFFDEGIVEGSGIWQNCLRDEVPVSRSLASRAIARNVKEGYLAREANDDQLGDEGDWMSLTAKGAKLALAVANENTHWDRIEEIAAESAKTTKTPRKASATQKATTPCKCGCGAQNSATYLPGHDAKHVSAFAFQIRSAKTEKAAQDAMTHASEVLSTKLYIKLARTLAGK